MGVRPSGVLVDIEGAFQLPIQVLHIDLSCLPFIECRVPFEPVERSKGFIRHLVHFPMYNTSVVRARYDSRKRPKGIERQSLNSCRGYER